MYSSGPPLRIQPVVTAFSGGLEPGHGIAIGNSVAYNQPRACKSGGSGRPRRSYRDEEAPAQGEPRLCRHMEAYNVFFSCAGAPPP
jgi:hypothetical protein